MTTETPMLDHERATELLEIYEEMKQLVRRAGRLVRGTAEEDRATSYWLAQLKIALDDEHGYLARGSVTMRSTIEALEGSDEEEE